MRNFLIIVLALALFILSALFFAQNDEIVIINYFSGQLAWQLNWVMVGCILCGFLIGVLAVLGSLLKTKFQLKRAQAKLARHSEELNSLRSLPIKDDF